MIFASEKSLFSLIFFPLFLASCAIPTSVTRPHGAPVPYGEGRHPGIDYEIPIGKPIIAVSDGMVVFTGIGYMVKKGTWYEFRVEYKHSHEIVPIKQPSDCEGYFVSIQHGDEFLSVYGHLTKFFFDVGQKVKRGELIGLSGASFNAWPHLHFGIARIGGRPIRYSENYDPNKFWLGGRPRCFDPKENYSAFSAKEITHPIACGKYAKELVSRTKKRD